MQLAIDFLLCGRPPHSSAKVRLARDMSLRGVQQTMPVRNLRFPFALRLCALHGSHLLRGGGRHGALREGEAMWIAPWRRFHYDGPDLRAAPHGGEPRLELDVAPAGWRHGDDGAARSSPDATLTLQVAHAVFAQPWADWSVAATAQRMGMSGARLSAGLFREGSALTAVVREQRLMRALVSLSATIGFHTEFAEQLAVRTGFGLPARFEAAFLHHFGFRPCAVNALSLGEMLAGAAFAPAQAR